MRLLLTVVLLLVLGVLAGIVHSETFVWVDEAASTQLL